MKQSLKYICGLLIMVSFSPACKKSDPMAFQAPDMVYIYKAPYALNTDSIVYSFAIKPDSLMVDTINIPVRIIGLAASKERKVILSAIPDSSNAVAGSDYQLLPYYIPAGAYTANLPVVVKRSAIMKTKGVTVLLNIMPSPDFLPGVPNSAGGSKIAGGTTRYLIRINDYLTKPANWDSWLVYFFGNYSAVKYKLVIEATGLAIFPSDLPYGIYAVYSTLCKQKLADYEAENGPLIDENGSVVSFD